MPIDVACPSCGYSAQVPDDFSGKLVACPACKNTFRIEPAASVIVSKSASFQRQPGDTAAFNQPFSPSVLGQYFSEQSAAATPVPRDTSSSGPVIVPESKIAGPRDQSGSGLVVVPEPDSASASFQRQPGDTGAFNQPFSPSVMGDYFKEPSVAPAAVPTDQPEWLRQFIKALVERSILSAADAWPAVQAVPAAERGDAQKLGQALARRGTLSWFQAALLSQGKADQLVLGNYVLLDKIGQGGFGTVFKARHRRMQRIVALKVLLPELMRDPQVLQRFQREVETAAKLTHPNIVTAYDADEARGAHFLAMEFVDGSDLGRMLKKHGPAPPPQAIDYIVQAARGLGHAHAAGIVHRDVKPNNLLLASNGVVKVSDLGLARLTQAGPVSGPDALTSTKSIMGTADYMAPEQALSTKTVDHRADIYSLGCTLYTLLTARPIYAGGTALEILLGHREAPIPQLPGHAVFLQGIFARMVAKLPENRYPSMAHVAADLERLGTARPVPVATVPAAEQNIVAASRMAVAPATPPLPSPVTPVAPSAPVSTSQVTPISSAVAASTSHVAPLTGQHPRDTATATSVMPFARRKLPWLVGGCAALALVMLIGVVGLVGLLRSGKSGPAIQAKASKDSGAGTATSKDSGPPAPPVDLHGLIRECVKEAKVKKTTVLGGAFAQGDFEELPTDGGILIGFDVGTGKFVANDTIGYLQPIYQTAGGEKRGKEIGKRPERIVTLKAKPGYAVGGMRIGAGGVMDGMAVTFMKLKGKFLDVSDAYESQWMGGPGGGEGRRLGGDGSVMIGVFGKTLGDGGPCRLGLYYPLIPTDWIVVFRSDDPKIWNDDVNKGPNHFAKSLELMPDTIRYLKLTNTQTKEFVITEMTKQRLTQVTDDGRYGWEGRNEFHYRVYHLGIFLRIWPGGAAGDVIITRHGPSKGWGFGDTSTDAGPQGYAWAGQPIAKTVFEIAVKSDALTEAEAKKLLKAGVVRE
jgi:serine/threonine protein kinase